MKKVLEIFLNAEGTRPVLVLISLLAASLCEAIGVGTLVPALAAISGAGQGSAMSSFGQTLSEAFHMVGIAPTLGSLLIVVTIAFLMKSLISFGALTYAGIAASRVSVRLRQRLITALFEASWSFYAGHQSGTFANAVSGDATRAGEAYLMAAQFAAMVVQSVVYAIVAVLIDWRLALIGFVVSAVMAQALSFLIRKSRRAGRKQTDRTKDLTVEVVDMLANIKPLKSMNRYQPLYASLQHNISKLQSSLNTKEISRQALSQGGDAILVISVAGVMYFAHTVWHTPIAELIVAGILFLKVVTNVTKLQRWLQQTVMVESAYERLIELVALAEARKEELSGRSEPDFEADFRFLDVSFGHGRKQVLKGVSLVIPARGITVLKGPSGAGKTTIIDLLIGLHRPTGGTIMLGETPLSEIDLLKLRSRIGYVPQELNLLHSTIRQNITLGDDTISDEAVMAALKLTGASAFIASLPAGLDSSVGEMGGRLSGGQRQRISLARALVKSPALLILDEVTSALDPQTEAEIIRNIADLSRRYTIIVITHHEAWAAIADRLYEVRHGTVRELAAPDVAPVSK
jgi:ATP-binding cassette subfamily C protein